MILTTRYRFNGGDAGMPDFDDDLKLARAAIQIAGDEIPIGDREQRIALLFAVTRHEGRMRALEALKTEQLRTLHTPPSRCSETRQ